MKRALWTDKATWYSSKGTALQISKNHFQLKGVIVEVNIKLP